MVFTLVFIVFVSFLFRFALGSVLFLFLNLALALLLRGEFSMRNLKKVFSVTLMAAALSALVGCGGDDKSASSAGSAAAVGPTPQSPLTLRVGHDSPETVPVAKALAKWGELVEQRTQGAVKVQIFNNGTVGSASDYAVNCQLGTLDVGAVNQSVMTSFIPEVAAIDIPYLITSYEQADKLFLNDGPLTQYYTNKINDAGINLVNLDVWEVGFRDFSNSKHPINSVDDIAGIRLRVLDSKVHQGFWKALGADPVPMSWGEAYTALQQKAIDGVENAISILDQNNIEEVNHYLAMTDHNYSSIFIIMSKQSYDKLSPEQQKIVLDSAKEAGVYEREEQRRQAEAAVNNLVQRGMELTRPDTTGIIEKTQAFLDEQKAAYPDIVKIIDSNK